MPALLVLACTNTSQHAVKEDDHQHKSNVAALELNNGAKWKADDVTRKNVAAIKQIVLDSNYYKNNASSFAQELQVKIDTLVQQCRMTGADHEALHLWLGNVIHDLNELQKNEKEPQTFTDLRKNVLLFDNYFE